MKFVDPTEPYRKFGSRLFPKKSRTSLNPTVQSRSENALATRYSDFDRSFTLGRLYLL
jgi:hypothetical protein